MIQILTEYVRVPAISALLIYCVIYGYRLANGDVPLRPHPIARITRTVARLRGNK